MADCVYAVSGSNTLVNAGPLTDDCVGSILLSMSEYSTLVENSGATNADLMELLRQIFVFDLETCSIVVGSSLVMFLVSYGAGNVVRWLGKA